MPSLFDGHVSTITRCAACALIRSGAARKKHWGGEITSYLGIFAELRENMNKTIGTLAFRRCSLIGIPKEGYCTALIEFFFILQLYCNV